VVAENFLRIHRSGIVPVRALDPFWRPKPWRWCRIYFEGTPVVSIRARAASTGGVRRAGQQPCLARARG